MERPIIGITMGDPASIGPEISVKALADKSLYDRCRPVIIGDSGIMERALGTVGMGHIRINPVKNIEEAKFEYGSIDVYDLENVDADALKTGEVSAPAGEAAFQYVKKVIELAKDNKVAGTVTNAISKEAINLAGHHYSGHTEIYADFTGTEKYTMMLGLDNLRVVHVSTHVSMREACDRVKKARVLEVIRIAWKACQDMGIDRPCIGVAGLNPHCGENGMFGREEIDEIMPAIEAARAEGMHVEGPIPADTVFSKARGGWYDVVVCMYHDQGHIPLKVLGFVYNPEIQNWNAVEGVNITLGLPIIRTSVDHGTAFDHAGKGDANELSLKNAIDYGVMLSKKKSGKSLSEQQQASEKILCQI